MITSTAEVGSDGVVRAAAANLNSRFLQLRQCPPGGRPTRKVWPLELHARRIHSAPDTPFRIVAGAAHSGRARGIMRSVRGERAGSNPDTAEQVWRCLSVQSPESYVALAAEFSDETRSIIDQEMVELEEVTLLPPREHFHDPCAMLIVRVIDTDGFPVSDFDLLFTDHTGNPDGLPRGFLVDRQKNRRSPNHITFYFNHAALVGAAEVTEPGDSSRVLRPALQGLKGLGFRITARPDKGLVSYVPAEYVGTERSLLDVLLPNQTTMLEIVLKRLVDRSTAGFDRATGPRRSFKRLKPEGSITEDDAE